MNIYHQRPFVNFTQNTPMPKSHVNFQTQKYSFSQQNYTGQFIITPMKIDVSELQKKPEISSSQKPLNLEKQIKIPQKVGINVQQGKNFTVLQQKNGSRFLQVDQKNKQYAKKTLQIVMVGFVILILIVGSIYSLILWDKMKTQNQNDNNQLQLTVNSTVVNGNVQFEKTASERNQQVEWKTLPNDQQSPMGFLEHKKGEKANHHLSNSIKNELKTSNHHSLSQGRYIQLRRHEPSSQI